MRVVLGVGVRWLGWVTLEMMDDLSMMNVKVIYMNQHHEVCTSVTVAMAAPCLLYKKPRDRFQGDQCAFSTTLYSAYHVCLLCSGSRREHSARGIPSSKYKQQTAVSIRVKERRSLTTSTS